jgi:3-isopropylmalate/(R)-2-methylmalate dehydratase large subunit
MRVNFTGTLSNGVTAKDVALSLMGRLGVSGGSGFALELAGTLIDSLSMEQRMTICNMSIEAGARSALIAPDATTFAFLEGRPHARKGADWTAAGARWKERKSDFDARFDADI